MTSLRMVVGFAVLAMGAFATWGLATSADEKESPRAAQTKPEKEQKPTKSKPIDQDLRHFMRLKLEASGKVLEGLAVEDYALIKEGATKLHQMSTAEKWRVLNSPLYRNHSSDFQRVTKELVEAADDENLDRAALKWMAATMGCIECHRYARGVFIASAGPSTTGQP